jgi:ADP-ribose pyrophosphatase YjhB (NUDIX family)
MRASRLLARTLHRLIGRARSLRRSLGEPGEGAHAAAFTPAGKLILVKLRYAPGWRLPGGGRADGETLEQAAVRELREEIGLVSHGTVADSAVAGVLVVRDVHYRPRRWSWEVEAVCEADMAALPRDLSPRTARWLGDITARI